MRISTETDWGEARVQAWRQRGLDLWAALGPELSSVVPLTAVQSLLSTLIDFDNPACLDASNAAHVMAQNDNLVVLAQWAEAPAETLAIALAAGFVHDLNKAPGELLRRDTFAVRGPDGRPVERIETDPEVVGLNHYGERTRSVLERLVLAGELVGSVASEIDRCIIHHGLGSSRFVGALVEGKIPWGRCDYVQNDGSLRFILPEQPTPTFATVLHDLADSAQQMQAGAAWVAKYPLGYWRTLGASWLDLLSGPASNGEVPTGLQGQLQTERETCQKILREALEAGILSSTTALRLERGIEALVGLGRSWSDARPETLDLPNGETVFHQLAQGLGLAPQEVRNRLSRLKPGEDGGVDARILRASHDLDSVRAHQLHAAVARRAPVV